MRTLFFLVIASAACLVSACSQTASDTEVSSEGELQGQAITEKDAGRTIVVAEGQTFSINLEENGTTGYQWAVTKVDRSLGQPFRTSYFPSESHAIGAGGERRLYWRTTSPIESLVGKHDIELQYVRSFDPSHPAKTLTFTIDIEPGGNPVTPTRVVEVTGGDNGKTIDVKEGQDFRVTLAGPSPTPFTGWKVVETTRTLGYPAKQEWIQGDGAVGQSGASTFLWHTAAEGPLTKVGEHQVALEIDRGHGDGVSRFEFTVSIAR